MVIAVVYHKIMPKINCKVANAIITRDQPDKPFSTRFGTRYSAPKQFAYTKFVGQTGVGPSTVPETSFYPSKTNAIWSLLEFASPIPVGNLMLVTQAWVKSSDWEWVI